MAQIKSDMKGSKRVFSGDADGTEARKGEDKENEGVRQREKRGHPRASTSTPATRAGRHTNIHGHGQASNAKRPSPRKLSRKPSAADGVDRELADEFGDMSIEDQGIVVPVITTMNVTAQGTILMPRSRAPSEAQPPQSQFLEPPTYPSSSIRRGTNDDLNRFVSSSTATSGTVLTVGSAGSFVKHAGPGHVAGSGNIRRIGPEDVQGMLGERVGRMVFDKVTMRWVKGVASKGANGGHASGSGGEEERTEHTRESTESEDVFRDIESLKDETQPHESDDGMSRITETDREREDPEVDDEEEMELTSFSFDGPSAAGIVQVMTGVDDMTTDSEDEEDDRALATETEGHEHDDVSGDGFDSDEELPDNMLPPLLAPAFSTPRPPMHSHSQPSPQTPGVRGVMKSSSNTPVSALKNGTGPRNHARTPANRTGHRRSVSFSDGKRDGPIRGVGKQAGTTVGVVGGDTLDEKGVGFVPSVRSKRIAEMMEDLESAGWSLFRYYIMLA